MKKPTHAENETQIVARITELLLQKGKSQKELVEYLGLQKNAYTEWKAGRSSSYRQYIDKIAVYLAVSPTYLLRGETGDELVLSQDEQELIRMYRILHSESKEKIMTTTEILVNLEKNNKNKSSE